MKIYNKFTIKNKGSEGFTLIELLTVIAIIAVLTAFLTLSYVAVRQRARDTQRKSDLKQIQSALELYRADNDIYPPSASSPFASCGNPFIGGSGNVQYMAKIPCDPQNPSSPTPYYYYQPASSTTTYYLAACAENVNDSGSVAVASEPSWWTGSGAASDPLGCSSTHYFLVSNP